MGEAQWPPWNNQRLVITAEYLLPMTHLLPPVAANACHAFTKNVQNEMFQKGQLQDVVGRKDMAMCHCLCHRVLLGGTVPLDEKTQ